MPTYAKSTRTYAPSTLAPCIPVAVGYSAGMQLLRYTKADGVEVIVDITTNLEHHDFYAEAHPARGEVEIVFRDDDGEAMHTITARTTMQQVTNAILELSAGNTIAVLWPKDERWVV